MKLPRRDFWRTPSLRFALGLPLGLACACAASVATLPQREHPRSAMLVPVPYLPPPAKVEMIPLRRDEACKWRDGYYDFIGGDYRWVRGEWIRLDAECWYAPPVVRMKRSDQGQSLMLLRPAFYRDRTGQKTCEKPAPCEPPEAAKDKPN